jgi:hypothetical protein
MALRFCGACLQDFDWDSRQDVELDVSIIPGT